MPKTKIRGHIAMTRKSPGSRTPEDRRGSPPQVRTVNVIYATHIPKRERKRALRDVYALEPVAPKVALGELLRLCPGSAGLSTSLEKAKTDCHDKARDWSLFGEVSSP